MLKRIKGCFLPEFPGYLGPAVPSVCKVYIVHGIIWVLRVMCTYCLQVVWLALVLLRWDWFLLRIDPSQLFQAPHDGKEPEKGHGAPVIVKLLGRLAKQQQSPVLAQLVAPLQRNIRESKFKRLDEIG